MYGNYEEYDEYERDYSTDSDYSESQGQITPEEVRSFRTKLEEKLHGKSKSELTALATKLGLLGLTIATALTSLLIIHNSARKSRLADVTIAQEQLISKSQQLAETEARLARAELAYYDLLTRWNKETPANPDKVGVIQAAVLNASQEIGERVTEQTRDRDSPHYGKPYLSALFSGLIGNRRTITDPFLAGKLVQATLKIEYADGTDSILTMSAEEVAAWGVLKDVMYLETLKPVTYRIDLAAKLRTKKLVETKFTGEIVQLEGLKGTVNPEQVQTDVDHPWLERLWNTELGPTIDDEFINQQER